MSNRIAHYLPTIQSTLVVAVALRSVLGFAPVYALKTFPALQQIIDLYRGGRGLREGFEALIASVWQSASTHAHWSLTRGPEIRLGPQRDIANPT